MTNSEIITAVSVCGAVLTSTLSVAFQFWTARMNARSAERIAALELYQPRLCDALADFAAAYSRLDRGDASGYAREQKPTVDECIAAYRDFLAAGYRLSALVPDDAFHRDLRALMDKLGETGFTVWPQTDALFRSVIILAASHISASKPTGNKRSSPAGRKT